MRGKPAGQPGLAAGDSADRAIRAAACGWPLPAPPGQENRTQHPVAGGAGRAGRRGGWGANGDVGLLPWAYPARDPASASQSLGVHPYKVGVHPTRTGLGQGLNLGGSVVQELGQAGVARNFEWRGLKPMP